MSYMGNAAVEAKEAEHHLNWLRREYKKFVDSIFVRGFFHIFNNRKCRECGWEGKEDPDCFGHNDFYCPACGAEALT